MCSNIYSVGIVDNFFYIVFDKSYYIVIYSTLLVCIIYNLIRLFK